MMVICLRPFDFLSQPRVIISKHQLREGSKYKHCREILKWMAAVKNPSSVLFFLELKPLWFGFGFSFLQVERSARYFSNPQITSRMRMSQDQCFPKWPKMAYNLGNHPSLKPECEIKLVMICKTRFATLHKTKQKQTIDKNKNQN